MTKRKRPVRSDVGVGIAILIFVPALVLTIVLRSNLPVLIGATGIAVWFIIGLMLEWAQECLPDLRKPEKKLRYFWFILGSSPYVAGSVLLGTVIYTLICGMLGVQPDRDVLSILGRIIVYGVVVAFGFPLVMLLVALLRDVVFHSKKPTKE